MEREQRLQQFVNWWRTLRGDEKGEGAVFLNELFKALGYAGGFKETGGEAEKRIQFALEINPATHYADLVIPGRALIEMKKRGENLAKHQQQAVSYWIYLTPHPRYVLLCNFDEVWIYDMERNVSDPIDRVRVEDLPRSWGALAFLLPQPETPIFNKDFDLIDLTERAAYSLAKVYELLTRTGRGLQPEHVRRFILQCMVALFSENIGLLPRYTFTRMIEDCQAKQSNAYELFTLLFFMMNQPGKKKVGRFYGVDYFNGGLFAEVHPIDLHPEELDFLHDAARHDWSKIRPSIFGRIFERSMEETERHKSGAHFTPERDILRIVEPVIIRPWQRRIQQAITPEELKHLHAGLCQYKVLDPACGSGNFLYVAYREMKKLEQTLFEHLRLAGVAPEQLAGRVSAGQFYGFDVNPFAVELAKVTLMIAKTLAVDELGSDENPLPLDKLDANIRCEDALFADWGDFDAVIGNPPYISGGDLTREIGLEAANRVRETFPDVPGRADYCVYWFRKAHDLMKPGALAGMVGTNTIRENEAREGGLDYIVDTGGMIYEAVSSMPWRDTDPQLEHDAKKAAVHVSIVCWSKGDSISETPHLWIYDEKRPEQERLVPLALPVINSSLSPRTDVREAAVLTCNIEPQRVFEGQKPGNTDAFTLDYEEAAALLRQDKRYEQVIFSYLIARDMLQNPGARPRRFIIDFGERDMLTAATFKTAFQRLEKHILADLQQNAKQEAEENAAARAKNPRASIKTGYQSALRTWWLHARSRPEMKAALEGKDRAIIQPRVSKAGERLIFDFADTRICFGDALKVYAFDDDYTFGILQSRFHHDWITRKSSTLKGDTRSTTTTTYDTFPFPQFPSAAQVKAAADAARKLHEFRRERMRQNGGMGLRQMYNSLALPGSNPLKDLHAALDRAVLAAYGFDPAGDVLAQLLALNQQVAEKIKRNEPVTVPGIPADYPNPAELVSAGCIQPPELL